MVSDLNHGFQIPYVVYKLIIVTNAILGAQYGDPGASAAGVDD